MTPPADFAALRVLLGAVEAALEQEGPHVTRRVAALRDAYPAALAALERVEIDLAELCAEVREWLCTKCRYVYPGPPQPGFSCVECPRCGGLTGPHTTMLHREAGARLARLEKYVSEEAGFDCREYDKHLSPRPCGRCSSCRARAALEGAR